jgi:hypothetical protein
LKPHDLTKKQGQVGLLSHKQVSGNEKRWHLSLKDVTFLDAAQVWSQFHYTLLRKSFHI